MPKRVTAKQLRYLLSKGSPLSRKSKSKFERELHRGSVRIKERKDATR